MKVAIRPMKIEDVPTVAEIDQQSFSLPWPEGSYRFEVANNHAARCLIAEVENGQVVAMIVSWVIADELHIATFATHPDFRRQGIGSRLLSEALHEAQVLGVRRAFLEVRASNLAAQAMYAKFGFAVTGNRPKYYKDNGEDAILMNLEQLVSA